MEEDTAGQAESPPNKKSSQTVPMGPPSVNQKSALPGSLQGPCLAGYVFEWVEVHFPMSRQLVLEVLASTPTFDV